MRVFLTLLAALVLCVVRADETPVRVRINVTSQPAGATVFVDGAVRGVTPLPVYDVTPGRHHVCCRLDGYEDGDRFVDSSESPNLEVPFLLSEVKGLLLVTSEPAGADIVIDGSSRGVTPRLVTDLAVRNAYSLVLRKAGFLEQRVAVKFDGRTPKVVSERLVEDAGVINVTSEPAGADVTVNGVPRGKTPVLVRGVPKGRAVVRFRLDGFKEETRELVLRAGEQQNLPIALAPLPGTLHLVSVPEGARFYLNDEARGVGPLAIPGLKPGSYVVRAEKEGYAVQERTVTIANGASPREEFVLSNVMGRLEIRTEPVGAEIVLDGRVRGVTRAKEPNAALSDVFAIENVKEGEHVLVVRMEGYADATLHPRVSKSQTAKGKVQLRRLFVPDVEIVTARGSHRGILKSNTPEAVEIEVSLGITRSFSRSDIRKMVFLKPDGTAK